MSLKNARRRPAAELARGTDAEDERAVQRKKRKTEAERSYSARMGGIRPPRRHQHTKRKVRTYVSIGEIKTVGGHQGICMVAVTNAYLTPILWWLYICGIQLKRLYPRSEFEPLLLGLLRLH